jgi:hypothetical protein
MHAWRNTSASKSASHTDIATNIDALSVATNCAWADEENESLINPALRQNNSQRLSAANPEADF